VVTISLPRIIASHINSIEKVVKSAMIKDCLPCPTFPIIFTAFLMSKDAIIGTNKVSWIRTLRGGCSRTGEFGGGWGRRCGSISGQFRGSRSVFAVGKMSKIASIVGEVKEHQICTLPHNRFIHPALYEL
jgi:hypothetical protein